MIIHDIEIRDRLQNSSINKFMYQYSSESMPKQTHANMVSQMFCSVCINSMNMLLLAISCLNMSLGVLVF